MNTELGDDGVEDAVGGHFADVHRADLRKVPTFLKLTCRVRGTNPSTFERKQTRAHQFGESK